MLIITGGGRHGALRVPRRPCGPPRRWGINNHDDDNNDDTNDNTNIFVYSYYYY